MAYSHVIAFYLAIFLCFHFLKYWVMAKFMVARFMVARYWSTIYKISLIIVTQKDFDLDYYTFIFKKLVQNNAIFTEALEVLLDGFFNSNAWNSFSLIRNPWNMDYICDRVFLEKVTLEKVTLERRIFPLSEWLFQNGAIWTAGLACELRFNISLLFWISSQIPLSHEVLFSNLEMNFKMISMLEKNGNTALHYAAEYGAPQFILEWALRNFKK